MSPLRVCRTRSDFKRCKLRVTGDVSSLLGAPVPYTGTGVLYALSLPDSERAHLRRSALPATFAVYVVRRPAPGGFAHMPAARLQLHHAQLRTRNCQRSLRQRCPAIQSRPRAGLQPINFSIAGPALASQALPSLDHAAARTGRTRLLQARDDELRRLAADSREAAQAGGAAYRDWAEARQGSGLE